MAHPNRSGFGPRETHLPTDNSNHLDTNSNPRGLSAGDLSRIGLGLQPGSSFGHHTNLIRNLTGIDGRLTAVGGLEQIMQNLRTPSRQVSDNPYGPYGSAGNDRNNQGQYNYNPGNTTQTTHQHISRDYPGGQYNQHTVEQTTWRDTPQGNNNQDNNNQGGYTGDVNRTTFQNTAYTDNYGNTAGTVIVQAERWYGRRAIQAADEHVSDDDEAQRTESESGSDDDEAQRTENENGSGDGEEQQTENENGSGDETQQTTGGYESDTGGYSSDGYGHETTEEYNNNQGDQPRYVANTDHYGRVYYTDQHGRRLNYHSEDDSDDDDE